MPQNLGKKLINSHLVGGGVTEGTQFADVYPKYSEHLADLAGRIAVCDAAIKPINRVALPDGSPRLLGAELTARKGTTATPFIHSPGVLSK